MPYTTTDQINRELHRILGVNHLARAVKAVRKEAMGRYMRSTPLHTRDLKWMSYVPGSGSGPQLMQDEIEILVANFRQSFAPYTSVLSVKSLYEDFDGMVFAWHSDDMSVRESDWKALSADPSVRPNVKAKLMWLADFIQKNGLWLLMPPQAGAEQDYSSARSGNLNDRHLSDYGYAFAREVKVTQGKASVPPNVDDFNDKGADDPKAQALLWQSHGNADMLGRVFEVVLGRTDSGLIAPMAQFFRPRFHGDTEGEVIKKVPCLSFSMRADINDTDTYKVGFSRFFINNMVPGSQWVFAPEGPDGSVKLVLGNQHALESILSSKQYHRLQPYMDRPVNEVMAEWEQGGATGAGSAIKEDRAKKLAYWTDFADKMRRKLNGEKSAQDRNNPPKTPKEATARMENARKQLVQATKKIEELSLPVEGTKGHGTAVKGKLVEHLLKNLRYFPQMARKPELSNHLYQVKLGDEQGGMTLVNSGEEFAMTEDQVKSLLDPGETTTGHRTDGRKLLYYLTPQTQPLDADGKRKPLGYGPWDIDEADRMKLRSKYKPLLDLLSRRIQAYRAADNQHDPEYRPHSPPQHCKWLVMAPRFQSAEVLEGGKANARIFNRKFVDVAPEAAPQVPQQPAMRIASVKVAQSAMPLMSQPAATPYSPPSGFKAQPGVGVRDWVVIVHDINPAKFAQYGGRRFPYESMKGEKSLTFSSAHEAMAYITEHFPGIPAVDEKKLNAATDALRRAKGEVAQTVAQPQETPEVQQEKEIEELRHRASETSRHPSPHTPQSKDLSEIGEHDLFSLTQAIGGKQSSPAATFVYPDETPVQQPPAPLPPEALPPQAPPVTQEKPPQTPAPAAPVTPPSWSTTSTPLPPRAPRAKKPRPTVAPATPPQPPPTLFASNRMLREFARKYGL